MVLTNNRILHTSDWHLGAPVNWAISEFKDGFWINLFRRYRMNAVEQVVSHAVRNSVDAVFVAGDITDVYNHSKLIPDIYNFLVSKVITPLRSNDIKLVLALGSHDIKTNESIELFLSLKNEFDSTLELLVPEGSEEFQTLKQRFSFKEINHLSDVVIWKNIVISCDGPPAKGRWIQFKHKGSGPVVRCANLPIYRAFGDKHSMTYGKFGCYYPGTPFARSSASDNYFTDAGPRYCLLNEIGEFVTPIRLNVPEVAVIKKTPGRNEWEIFYLRDHEKETWIKEPVYKESVDNILENVLNEKPRVAFVTFVIEKYEQEINSNLTLQKIIDFIGNKQKIIIGSRKGIITTMLADFC